VAEHTRDRLDTESTTGAGSIPAGSPARNQGWDRFCGVVQWNRIFAFDSVNLIQFQIKIDVAVDGVDSADTVEIQHLILPLLVMVNVAERDFWQDWLLRTEGVVSHELTLQSSKLPNEEIHRRLSASNLVPSSVPRAVCGCVDKNHVDVFAI